MEKTKCIVSNNNIINISTDDLDVLYEKEKQRIKNDNKKILGQHIRAIILAIIIVTIIIFVFSFCCNIPFAKFFTPDCNATFIAAVILYGFSICIGISCCDEFESKYDKDDWSLQYRYRYYTENKNILKAEYSTSDSLFGLYCTLWLDLEDINTHKVVCVRIGSFMSEIKTNVSNYTFDLEAEKAYIPYKKEVI